MLAAISSSLKRNSGKSTQKTPASLVSRVKIEPFTNHNYLKSVYETQKPHFAPSRDNAKPAEKSAVQAEEEKVCDAIQYVERFIQLGREDVVKGSPQHAICLKHRHKKQAL